MTTAQKNAALRQWLKEGSANTRQTQKRIRSSWASQPPTPAFTPAPAGWTPPSTPQYSPMPSNLPVWTQPAPQPTFVVQPAPPPVGVRAPGYQLPTYTPAPVAQPPDPLGFLPGGSEAFWERASTIDQLPGAVADTAARGWRTVVDKGSDLGIDFSTPGTDAYYRNKARERADKVAAAQKTVDNILAEGREKEQRRKRNRKEEITELTWDEWTAMTPQQQAAVQFNGDLVAAVQRDRNQQQWYRDNVGEAERVAYENAIERMFGTTDEPTVKGIEYAPETVALLEQLDLPTVRAGNKTLDDYLKLDVAISAKDVKNIDAALTPTRTGAQEWEFSPRDERLRHAQMLTNAQMQLNTQAMEDQMAVGEQLLLGTTRGSANELATEEFGARERKTGMDRISIEEAQILDEYVAGLASPAVDLDEAFNMIQTDLDARGATPDDQRRVFGGLRDMLSSAAVGKTDWFGEQREAGQEFRDPQVILQAMGVGAVQPEGVG